MTNKDKRLLDGFFRNILLNGTFVNNKSLSKSNRLKHSRLQGDTTVVPVFKIVKEWNRLVKIVKQ